MMKGQGERVPARFKAIAAVVARNTALMVLQIGGLALVALGLFMLAPWLGIVAAGAALTSLGWVLDGKD